MKRSIWQGPLALGLSLLLVSLPAWSATAPLGKIIPGDGTSLNGVPLKFEGTLYSGDTLSTQAASGAAVMLRDGDQVQFGPMSAATLVSTDEELLVKLDRGFAVARSGQGQVVSVSALGLTIRPAEAATYQVTIEGSRVLVTSRQGSLQVQASNRSAVVPSGKAMRFVLAQNTAPGRTGAGANNVNTEALIILILVAAGAITGGVIAAKNDKPDVVSPSAP